MRQAARVVGIVGGVLGILSGFLGPYAYAFFAGYSGWAAPEFSSTRLLLSPVIGILCGAAGIAGGVYAIDNITAARALLLSSAVVGFAMGYWWALAAVVLLVAGVLATVDYADVGERHP